MTKRLPKLFALTGITAALALGGAGIAQASPDHHRGRDDARCAKAQGKKRDCERRHSEHAHSGHERHRS